MSNIYPVATFEKVPLDQFIKDAKETWLLYSNEHLEISADDDNEIEKVLKEVWENIELPKRSTSGSAGYDFHIPFTITLLRGSSVLIPTGICCNFHCRDTDGGRKIFNNYTLDMYPRSGLGFNYQCRLTNTVGIIDEDFYYSDVHGHILLKMTYEGITSFSTSPRKGITHMRFPREKLVLKRGDRFAQGIIRRFYTATNDSDMGNNVEYVERTGGFGSTGK